MTIETIARIVIGTIIGIVIKTLKTAMITKAVIKAVIKIMIKTLKTAITAIVNITNTVFKGSYKEVYRAGCNDINKDVKICETNPFCCNYIEVT